MDSRLNIRWRERWEVIALVPTTLVLAPLLAYGTIGLSFAVIGIAASPDLSGAKTIALGLVATIAAQSLLGVGSLVCLWVLVLRGVAWINQVATMRWVFVAMLAAGEGDVAYFLVGKQVLRDIMADLWSVLLWSLVLALPMFLGIKYLVLLLRRSIPVNWAANRRDQQP